MPASPESIDVAILTVLPEEYQAVCEQLEQLRPASSVSGAPNIYQWQIGQVDCSRLGGMYTVSVGMMGRAGNPQSALATVEAIQRWKPRYILFVGVAGGLATLNKGDVVISDLIHGYEYGKQEATFLPRDNWTFSTDLGLYNTATAYAQRADWQTRVRTESPSAHLPRAVPGEVASGDKVVDNPTNAFFRAILKRWSKIIAVEMEGAGVGAAIEQAHALGHALGFMMIRGISDVPRPPQEGETRGTTERDNWKPYASATAAAFAVGLIAHGLPEPPHALPGDTRQTSPQTSIAVTAQPLSEATINHGDVIDLFDELMRSDCKSPVLRLQGDAKLGKTHFVKTVFPAIARQQYNARCVIVDLRTGRQGPIEILHDICGQLGGEVAFPRFHEAYTRSRNRSLAPVAGLQGLLSRFQAHPDQEANENDRVIRDLLSEFVADLTYSRDTRIALFFDAIDLASPHTGVWLVNTLLVRISHLSHVRAVISGRSIPIASGGFATMCCEYELGPVTEEEAYIRYCKERGLNLSEQWIREKVRFCEYKPGNFVDILGRKSMRVAASHA